jgi:small subunit ribosomal protein S5
MAFSMNQQRGGGRGGRPGQSRFSKPRRISEYAEKVLEVRRVTRVMAGGKRFSFRAAVVIGSRTGKVGVGVAKGLDFVSSVEKAKRQAEKNMVTIPLKDNRTIAFDVEAKYGAARVRVKPAAPGHGLIAGSSARTVLDLAGVKDVSAKIIGTTKNKIANAVATIEALKKLKGIADRKKAVAPVGNGGMSVSATI